MSDTEFAIFNDSQSPPGSPLGGQRRAVIDIGTNSIKLLVAEFDGAVIRPVLETSEQTRLGSGFYQTQRLQPAAIEASVQAVCGFTEQAKALGASSIRLIATSAVRDAKNSSDLTSSIRQITGLDVEVISGEQEANWAFAGVTGNSSLADHPILVIDVGGGSTEFIFGQNGHASFRRSYPFGTVRLLEQWKLADPPTTAQFNACQSDVLNFLQTHVAPDLKKQFEKVSPADLKLIGTGGTPAILARIYLQLDDYDRDRIESVRLKQEDVRRMARQLWELPIEQRRLLPGLPSKRADVILSGVMIYLGMMEVFGFQQLEISTRGLRFAVIAAMH